MQAVKQVLKDLRGKNYLYLKATAFVLAAWLGGSLIGCTKGPVTPPVVVDTIPPIPTTPTGTIKEFTIDDTLVGYKKGSVYRWNVIGTNVKTKVMLLSPNSITGRLDTSVLPAFYGVQQTGPFTETKQLTLYVNSGKQITRTLKVADSLTTLLWNSGKRWITADVRSLEPVSIAGQTQSAWVSYYSVKPDKYANERTSFFLDGSSKEEQLSSAYPQPKPSGKFYMIPNLTDPATGLPQKAISWKGRLYYIDTIEEKTLVMRFDTLQGGLVLTKNKVRYTAEF